MLTIQTIIDRKIAKYYYTFKIVNSTNTIYTSTKWIIPHNNNIVYLYIKQKT